MQLNENKTRVMSDQKNMKWTTKWITFIFALAIAFFAILPVSEVYASGYAWTVIGQGAQFDNPFGIALDSAGNLFVPNQRSNTISEGSLVNGSYSWTTIAQSGQNGASFNGVQGIAVDSHGNLFVGNYYTDTIQEGTLSNGSFSWTTIGRNGVNGGSFTLNNLDPMIAVDSSDDVFVMNGASVEEGTLSNGSYSWTTIGNFPGFQGIAIDSAGNLYIWEVGTSSGTIDEGTPSNGTFSWKTIDSNVPGITGNNYICDLAIGSNGTLYLANRYNYLEGTPSNGSYSWTNIGGTTGVPWGIAVDSAGHLFASIENISEIDEGVVLVDAATPSITTQPQGATVNAGDTSPSLSVTATVSDGGTLSYQWYSNTTNSTSGGTPISGATSSSYSAPTTSAGTNYYYVVVTNTNNSVNGTKTATATSSVAKVTVNALVNAATPIITTQPHGATVNAGDTSPSLSVTATVSDGGTLSYQWYSNTTNSTSGGTPISGATSSSYSAPTTSAGTNYYYVVVTNTNNSVNGTKTATATSSVAKVNVTVRPLSVGTTWVWNGQYGVPYNPFQLQPVSGQAPYVWSLVSGRLPSGLTLSSGGVISGTPTGPDGTSTFTVQVTDVNGRAARQTLSIQITGTPPLSITTGTLPPLKVGTSDPVQLAGVGASPYTWSVVSGQLPTGLSLDPSGMLSGIPTKSGSFTFDVQLANGSQTAVTKQFTVTVAGLPHNERLVLWNGQSWIVPALVHQHTTYVPIWYVMHLLKPMGVNNTWNGRLWHMTTANPANLSNISAGHGTSGIYLNGTLVQHVTPLVAIDPWSQKPTTYMPIWYVMKVLERVGLQSTWNGTTWTVTK